MKTEVVEVKERVVTIRCHGYTIDFWKKEDGGIVRGGFIYEGHSIESDWIPRDIYDATARRAVAIFFDQERRREEENKTKQTSLF